MPPPAAPPARPCRDRHPDPAATQGACHLCRLAAHDGRYQRLWGLPVTAPERPLSPAPPGRQGRVRYCPGRRVYDWSVTDGGRVADAGSEPTEAAAWAEVEAALGAQPPRVAAVFDEDSLAPGLKGWRFNASLLAWRGKYLLAFRTGWAGSEVGLAELGPDLRPTGAARLLNLRHPAAAWGREDPRLFVHHGRLHVSFTGVVVDRGVTTTNVLYALLRDDWSVEAVHHPQIPDRQPWEKNHAYFSHNGELFAVYSVRPHRVYRVEGAFAELRYETPGPPEWSGGYLRGGAGPVFFAGRYWHWFHGRVDGARSVYNAGVYTFEPRPPFRVTACTPDPVYVADPATNTHGNYADVFFVAGAVRAPGGGWLLSGGEHDRRAVVLGVSDDLVAARLRPL